MLSLANAEFTLAAEPLIHVVTTIDNETHYVKYGFIIMYLLFTYSIALKVSVILIYPVARHSYHYSNLFSKCYCLTACVADGEGGI